jgi:NAD(P)H-hydrate repair Nnr-like enzyme with NAD(P)H-hydrate dehydratase domain
MKNKFKLDIPQIVHSVNSVDKINYQELVRKNQDTNKGDFGSIAIIGGGTGMYGSLLLAGRAAMFMCAGKVTLGFNGADSPVIDPLMPELMISYSALIIGPGLGLDAMALKVLIKIIKLQPKCALIFDADALNLLAIHRDLHAKFNLLSNVVITPHPKEASRLLDISVEVIQENRISAISLLQKRFNAGVLLKGHGSLICDKETLFINANGNCSLSNAGQGDALSGMIAAFVAQGLNLLSALQFAVYIQGCAADDLVSSYGGYNGILATDIIVNARKLLNKILYSS